MQRHLPEHDVERQAEVARDLLAAIADHDDDAELVAGMIEGETGFLEAIEAAIAEIDDCDVTIAGCKSVIEGLASRATRSARRRDNIRAAIERAMVMLDLPSLKMPTATISVAHRPGKAVITDEAAIPAAFWKPQPPTLDKTALNAAVAEHDVPGAHQGNGTVSLTIRRK